MQRFAATGGIQSKERLGVKTNERARKNKEK